MAIGVDYERNENYMNASVHLVFLDSVSFLPFPLRKLPETFGLTVAKSWYPHYSNTRANLDYVGNIPVIKYYGVDEMSASERNEFLAW